MAKNDSYELWQERRTTEGDKTRTTDKNRHRQTGQDKTHNTSNQEWNGSKMWICPSSPFELREEKGKPTRDGNCNSGVATGY